MMTEQQSISLIKALIRSGAIPKNQAIVSTEKATTKE